MKLGTRTAVLLVATIVLIGGMALAVTGAVNTFFQPPAESPANAASASSQNELSDNLGLIVGGVTRSFKNGDEAPITSDVVAKINVARGDERYSRRVDIYLYHQSSSEPVDNATAQVIGQMRYMDHGAFRTVPLQSDGGHYIVHLPFVMPGEWEVDFYVSVSGKQTKIQLMIDLFD